MEKTYKLLKLLLLVLAFAVVITGAWLVYNKLSSQVDLSNLAVVTNPTAQTQADPEPMPDFTVYDGEGNPVKLSDFRGKPVILNFWASWCGPCVSEMPEFQTFFDRYGTDIHFVLVNLTDGSQETVESASQFIADQGYTFPVYFDTDRDAMSAYSITGVPVSYFLDKEGYLVAWAQGALSAERLQTGVDRLLDA